MSTLSHFRFESLQILSRNGKHLNAKRSQNYMIFMTNFKDYLSVMHTWTLSRNLWIFTIITRCLIYVLTYWMARRRLWQNQILVSPNVVKWMQSREIHRLFLIFELIENRRFITATDTHQFRCPFICSIIHFLVHRWAILLLIL